MTQYQMPYGQVATFDMMPDQNVRLAEILLHGLVEKGPMPVKEIKRIAKEEGIPCSALLQAKAKLGVKDVKPKVTRHLNDKHLKGERLWEKKDQQWTLSFEGDDALRLSGEMYLMAQRLLKEAKEAIAAGKPFAKEYQHLKSWEHMVEHLEDRIRIFEEWHRLYRCNPLSMYHGDCK
jgi:hypothetical protein